MNLVDQLSRPDYHTYLTYIELQTNRQVQSALPYLMSIHSHVKIPHADNEVHEHLLKMIALTSAEEMQMYHDIQQYDRHFQKLNFTPYDDNYGYSEGIVQVKFVVKGLSESRPKISLGDVIHLRPSREDIIALSQRDGLARDIIELQGIVIECKLKTEEITCQFALPRPGGLGIPLSVILLEFNEHIRFHVRFSFARYGMAFIHEALQEFLTDNGLDIALFPDKFPRIKDESLEIETSPHKAKASDALRWNDDQLFAIDAISCRLWTNRNEKVRLPPFIIHGPAGTGKHTSDADIS